MMTTGFLELVVLLTTLGGFGVDANPKAPSGPEVMKYAPADADFMLHVDMQAVVPRNYNFLKSLAQDQKLAAHPGARTMIEDAVREIDMGVNMAKGTLKLDPINDLHSMTVWVKVLSGGTPDFLVVVRGNVTDKLLEPTAGMGFAQIDVEGNKGAQAPDGSGLIVVRKGELFIGTPSWVKARLARSWRAPRIAGGSPAAEMRAMLSDKPFFMIASKPSQQAVRRIMSQMPDDNVLADLIGGHKFGAVALTSKGMSWNFHAHTQDGYKRALMASEGALDVFRAGHLGTRGLARLALSAMYSYRGKVKEIDAILQHENELMAVLDDFTGDGKFKSNIKKNAKKFTVSVKATGKKLSDVLPLMGFVPGIGAAAYLTMSGDDVTVAAEPEEVVAADKPAAVAESEKARAQDSAPVAAPSSVNVQTLYRAAKQARGM